jgi:hypothetical protein
MMSAPLVFASIGAGHRRDGGHEEGRPDRALASVVVARWEQEFDAEKAWAEFGMIYRLNEFGLEKSIIYPI